MLQKLKLVPSIEFIHPTSSFYILGRYDFDMTASDMVEFLIDRKVAVKGGSEFGPSSDGCIRLTYATNYEEALKGVDQLGAESSVSSKSKKCST